MSAEVTLRRPACAPPAEPQVLRQQEVRRDATRTSDLKADTVPTRVEPGPRVQRLQARRRRQRNATRVGLPSVAALVALTAAMGNAGGAAPRADGSAPAAVPPLSFRAAPQFAPLDVRTVVRHLTLPPASAGTSLPVALTPSAKDIPPVALLAYQSASRRAAETHPGCAPAWQLLAAIGLVESGHARAGGSASKGWDGTARPPVYGVALDGRGVGRIFDTDRGRTDGDTRWDRAVGPMQLIPATWARFAADGDRDGTRDPQSIWDASLAAANYLCTAAAPLTAPDQEIRAIYSYNHSFAYVRAVLATEAVYRGVDASVLGIGSLPAGDGATASPLTATTTPSPERTGRPLPSPSPAAGGPPSAQPSATVVTPSAAASEPAASESPSAAPSDTGEPTDAQPPMTEPSPSP